MYRLVFFTLSLNLHASFCGDARKGVPTEVRYANRISRHSDIDVKKDLAEIIKNFPNIKNANDIYNHLRTVHNVRISEIAEATNVSNTLVYKWNDRIIHESHLPALIKLFNKKENSLLAKKRKINAADKQIKNRILSEIPLSKPISVGVVFDLMNPVKRASVRKSYNADSKVAVKWLNDNVKPDYSHVDKALNEFKSLPKSKQDILIRRHEALKKMLTSYDETVSLRSNLRREGKQALQVINENPSVKSDVEYFSNLLKRYISAADDPHSKKMNSRELAGVFEIPRSNLSTWKTGSNNISDWAVIPVLKIVEAIKKKDHTTLSDVLGVSEIRAKEIILESSNP